MTLTHKEAIDGNIFDDSQAVENLEMNLPILDRISKIQVAFHIKYYMKTKIQLFDKIVKSVLYRYMI